MSIVSRESRHRLISMVGDLAKSLTIAVRASCSTRAIWEMLVENATLIVLGLTTAIFGAVLVVLVIFPRYRDRAPGSSPRSLATRASPGS